MSNGAGSTLKSTNTTSNNVSPSSNFSSSPSQLSSNFSTNLSSNFTTKISSNLSNNLSSTSSTTPYLIAQCDAKDNPITIHLAERSDLPCIVAIYNQSVVTKIATADLEPVALAQREAWFDEHQLNPNRPIYVVKNEQGEVMAWGCFNDVKKLAAYHISSEISIYVNEDFQRLKLASILLEWMLSQTSKLGILNVIAYIFAHNKPSIGLFTKFGFETWGKLPNVCDLIDFKADVIIMGKSLNHSK